MGVIFTNLFFALFVGTAIYAEVAHFLNEE